jgi:phenylalanine-4-hydroxylase
MSKYESYTPDEDGNIPFTSTENKTWKKLFQQQIGIIQGRACDEFLEGLKILNLEQNQIPTLREVSRELKKTTGWLVEPVPAVIPAKDFFELLANKKFPCATFIRSEQDFSYIKEPDIFHELFGHCPMLTQPEFADFVSEYGKFSLSCQPYQRKYLFRLFWFTVEFGLINTPKGIQAYGGGILSSPSETKSSVDNSVDDIQYENLDPLTVFRTPYRIDLPQKLYYVINSFQDLFSLKTTDLKSMIEQAAILGDIKPKFPLLDGKGDILEYTN